MRTANKGYDPPEKLAGQTHARWPEMKLKPEIEAEISMLPAESSPRKGPIRDDIIGYYGCPMVLPSGNWDCRMVFPDAHGQINFGQTTRALIQFLSPQDALKGVREGDCFELWDMGIIVTGIVKKIIGGPTLGSVGQKLMQSLDYLSYAKHLVERVVSRHSMHIVKHDKSAMGEWYVYFGNPEFILSVWRDRSGYLGIELGSKIRRKPRAHLRGPWSMSHLRGYLDGSKDHYRFASNEEQAAWFEENESTLFNSEFLNSDELNQWAVTASRRLFGQDADRNTQPSLKRTGKSGG